MKSIKFTKIDFIMSRSQFKLLIIFILISLFIIVQSNDTMFIITYLNFGTLIISITPFTLESTAYCGFTNLLPAKVGDRVTGRYLYFLFLTGIINIIGTLMIVFFDSYYLTGNNLFIYFIIIAFNIIIGSLQFLLFYVVGQFKSQQVMSLVRMVPGFLFFFIMSGFSNKVTDNPELMTSLLKNIVESLNMIAYVSIAIAFFVFLLCIFLSTSICKKKDIG